MPLSDPAVSGRRQSAVSQLSTVFYGLFPATFIVTKVLGKFLDSGAQVGAADSFPARGKDLESSGFFLQLQTSISFPWDVIDISLTLISGKCFPTIYPSF